MRAVSNLKRKSIARTSLIRTLIFAALVLLVGAQFDAYNQAQLAVVLILFIGVLSITLLTGISGQLSLGQGALMAVGGYSTALLITNYTLSLWVAIPLSVISSAIAGLLLGVAAARLRGPYLAGTTLVIALAIPTIANRFMSVFKGDEGLQVDVGYPPQWFSSLFGEPTYEQWQLYVALPFAGVALFFASNILLSRTGRMWRSIRDNESAASLAGVNFSRQKIYVFVISSTFAGLSGALYGLRGLVGPSVYPVSLSLLLLTAAVLGGIRSITGAFIGTVIVVFLPDWIELILGNFGLSEQVSNFLPALISSLLLILTVVINPAGVAGARLHKHK
ncbi:MAG: branched-chain amino acid ABC transporter permease [Candidatus Planktophila sp.]|nr:branched-chain amino acid ABC transporter permease [Candidatus Planktophila sp.]MSO25193.1 branched-chain amino acid ABC transporter permease [Candidatus Planktophila sp.]